MNKIIKYVFFLIIVIVFNSCSMFKLQLDAESEPLNNNLILTRNLTHAYASTFFHDITNAADSIFEYTQKREIQINALLWKIIATKQAKNKIFQNDPQVALLDIWVLSATMNDYLSMGEGKNIFEEEQSIAIDACNGLLNKIDIIAQKAFKSDYPDAKYFVDSIRLNAPSISQDFYRESVFNNWYTYKNIPDSLANKTVGTLPQVLSDFSTKITVGSEQTLHQTQWLIELMLKRTQLDSLDLQKISTDFNKHTNEIIQLLHESGNSIQKEAVNFHRDFRFLMNNLNKNLDSITLFASREMAVFRDSLTAERKAVMQNLDETSNRVVKTAMEEIRLMIKDVLFYVVLILIVILFIPFVLGYMTGRVFTKNKKNNK